MNQPEHNGSSAERAAASESVQNRQLERRETRRWWIKLLLQPALLLVCGAALIGALGVAQRLGYISAGGGSDHGHAAAGREDVLYICPMMCTPPQAEPGRCPVCGMELVPSTSGGGQTDERSVHIDPAARRIANIQTVAVSAQPVTRTIRTVGELSYDEGTLKTIAAYVDGRLDRLYADYTGVVVQQGDPLALLYSPQLYAGQVELLLAKKAVERTQSATASRVLPAGTDLYQSAKQRLVLLGMTEAQIAQLEQAGQASSHLQLNAPNSGTVIEKLAVEGQYVREGDAIYRLADLSALWLMLRLFPEDAALIRYGQKVSAEVQSLPGQPFAGRVAFIDPRVDPQTRTVGVRVVIPNAQGELRVGDYARARIEVPVHGGEPSRVYDPELADKWISPRHPHVIADSPGPCPVCDVPLVPAAQFGFTNQPPADGQALVVPRDAVLMAGSNSVVYVEKEPGRFEIRRVVLGPSLGDRIVIRSGVAAGEQVATRGNFLIDSQMQLAGNPSLIDPTRLEAQESLPESAPSAELIAALESLPPEDRARAQQQGICPVAELPLGSMGTPPKVDVQGTPVFICCEGCRGRLLADPDQYLAKLPAEPAGGMGARGSGSRDRQPSEIKPRSSEANDDPPADDSQMDLPPLGLPQLIEPEDEGSEPPRLQEASRVSGSALAAGLCEGSEPPRLQEAARESRPAPPVADRRAPAAKEGWR